MHEWEKVVWFRSGQDGRGGNQKRRSACAEVALSLAVYPQMGPYVYRSYHFLREAPPFSCQVRITADLVALELSLVLAELRVQTV